MSQSASPGPPPPFYPQPHKNTPIIISQIWVFIQTQWLGKLSEACFQGILKLCLGRRSTNASGFIFNTYKKNMQEPFFLPLALKKL